MRFTLPEEVLAALAHLEAQGHAAYVVGGCVRDLLRGVTPHDYDICTDALPDEISACFAGEKTADLGANFGTVGVFFGGQFLEITTFRMDGEYLDGRHPKAVSFTNALCEDLRRRDFTINAMAYHPARGLQDYFGGQDDLRAGRIRCVGEARERFGEDALRILRALRFAAVLGFAIAPETAEAMAALAGGLSSVSVERIGQELEKLIQGKDAPRAFAAHPQVVMAAAPEFAPDAEDWPLRLDALAYTPADVAVKWAVLLKGRGPQALDRLRMPKSLRNRVAALLAAAQEPVEVGEVAVKRGLGRWGAEEYGVWLDFQDALGKAASDAALLARVYEARMVSNRLLAENACFRLAHLAVDGEDLIGLGMRGPEVGRLLKRLLDVVIDGKLPNERGSLLSAASAWTKEETGC